MRAEILQVLIPVCSDDKLPAQGRQALLLLLLPLFQLAPYATAAEDRTGVSSVSQ
jgi:hypothetical protein